MSAKNLDEYIAKMRAICDTRESGSVIISTKHIIKIMDIISCLKQANQICVQDHKGSGHQQQTIEVIDQLIKDLDETDGRLH